MKICKLDFRKQSEKRNNCFVEQMLIMIFIMFSVAMKMRRREENELEEKFTIILKSINTVAVTV